MKLASIAVLSASILLSLSTLVQANPTWNNSGSDWFTASNWNTTVAVPTSTLIAKFTTAPVYQPVINGLEGSATAEALDFTVGGYDLTATNGGTLTFGSPSWNQGDGNGTYNIDNYPGATGTNIVNVPMLLTASTGKTQNFASSGGTLWLDGTIGDAAGGSTDTVYFYTGLSSAVVEVTGANTFTNAVQVGGTGKTEVNTVGTTGNASALGENGTVTLNGDLNYIGVGETSNKTFNLEANGTIDTTGATGALILSGQVTGTGYSLTKAGPGTLGLSYATGDTYTGGTTVSGGTLLVSNTSGSATGSGTVSLGAATLAGPGIISGQVHATGASDASNITAATTSTIGNLSLSGGLTGTTGLTLNLAVDGASATNSTLTLGAALTDTALTFNLYDLGSNSLVDNTPYTLITGTGAITDSSIAANLLDSSYTLNASYGTDGILVSGDSATFEVASVPEPSTCALLGVGFLALMLISARHRLKCR